APGPAPPWQGRRAFPGRAVARWARPSRPRPRAPRSRPRPCAAAPPCSAGSARPAGPAPGPAPGWRRGARRRPGGSCGGGRGARGRGHSRTWYEDRRVRGPRPWARSPPGSPVGCDQPDHLECAVASDDERIALFLDYENLAIGARDGLGVTPFDFGPIADALA